MNSALPWLCPVVDNDAACMLVCVGAIKVPFVALFITTGR
jgi:hypothetical protein